MLASGVLMPLLFLTAKYLGGVLPEWPVWLSDMELSEHCTWLNIVVQLGGFCVHDVIMSWSNEAPLTPFSVH